MNMAANSDKMAVTDTQSFPVHGSESRDDSDVKSQAKPNHEVTLKKKSTFKITSVTKSYGPGDLSNDHDHELDSMDDLDETMESHTEDASSEILDISKHTDGGEPSSPMEEETSDNVMNVKEKSDLQGPHSTRFKVVKIETREPFKRGRWTCLDTLDYPAPDKSDSKTNIDSNIGTSGVPTSTSLHQSVVVDEVYKNPTKAANVIQGENKENNLDNYQNSSTIRQSQLHQTQIQQTPASPNVHSNVAQQQIQTHPAHSNIQSNTVLSQSTSSVNTSIVQGQSSMQMNDQPQTTYIYTGAVPGPTASVIQNVVSSHSSIQNAGGSNLDDVQQFNQVQHVSNENLMPNVDNMEQNSTVSATMGADTQHNPITTEVPILTPQTVAEAVGIIPQEEDRNVYSRKLNNEVILFNRNGEMDNFRAAEHFSPFRTPGARGSSTVAIDNKIEQAMDLVKSHLMYAVREEVEVLKEQIKELMDKNSQLEYENQILKSSASPETLAKLSNLPSSSSS